MYTIFINESVIYLTEKPLNSKGILSENYDEISLEVIIDNLENGALKSVNVYADDLELLLTDFKSYFNVIEAAGGLVFNEKNETLWIYRYDKWDLPKGKVENGESIEEAATREVEEECGVTISKTECLMSKTYHVYRYGKKRILKITYWYKMYAKRDQNLSPQLEENITKVEWKDSVKVEKVLENTYDNIKLLCRFALPNR